MKRGERGGSAGGREFGRGEGRNSRGVVERTNEGARRERGRERERKGSSATQREGECRAPEREAKGCTFSLKLKQQ